MDQIYDVIIVGAGPAGLSAAIYMARANYNVLVLEQEKIGGQITITEEVVNYPAVLKTSGAKLTETMHKQGENFGAKFQIAEVTAIDHSDKVKKLTTNKGEFSTLGVILALGANPRKLGFEGEAEFQGRGVAYCATCDGEFFKGMEVYVVGGGFAAVEEGIFLTKYATHVHMIVRGDSFSCAKSVADKALQHPKVTVHFETEMQRVEGDSVVQSVTLVDKDGKTEKITPPNGVGVFVFAGYVPNTKWLPESITRDNGYIVTDMNRQTNIEGIFAAGDVCIKELRQVVTAVSDGATAATSLEKQVESLRKELDLPEYIPETKESGCGCGSDTCGSHSCGDENVEVDPAFANHEFISGEMAVQMKPVLDNFKEIVTIKAHLGTNDLAKELEQFAKECSVLTDKIVVEFLPNQEGISYLELCHSDGTSSGVQYEAIPGGHEFNSFLLGMYQLAGGKKPLEQDVLDKINALDDTNLTVMISLSCSNCPDVVVACQRIAIENPKVNARFVDIAHNETLREKYKVMSVPCLVIGEDKVHFGKKNMEQILELI